MQKLQSILYWLADADLEILSRPEVNDDDKRRQMLFGFAVLIACIVASLVTYYSVKTLSESGFLALLVAGTTGVLVLMLDRTLFRTISKGGLGLRIFMSVVIGFVLSSGAKMAMSESVVTQFVIEKTRLKNERLYTDLVGLIIQEYDAKIQYHSDELIRLSEECGGDCVSAIGEHRRQKKVLVKEKPKMVREAKKKYEAQIVEADFSKSSMVIALWEITFNPHSTDDRIAWILHIMVFILIFTGEALPSLLRLTTDYESDTYFKSVVHKKQMISKVQTELYQIDYLEEPERLKNLKRRYYQEKIIQIRCNHFDTNRLDELYDNIVEAEKERYHSKNGKAKEDEKEGLAATDGLDLPKFEYK